MDGELVSDVDFGDVKVEAVLGLTLAGEELVGELDVGRVKAVEPDEFDEVVNECDELEEFIECVEFEEGVFEVEFVDAEELAACSEDRCLR